MHHTHTHKNSIYLSPGGARRSGQGNERAIERGGWVGKRKKKKKKRDGIEKRPKIQSH